MGGAFQTCWSRARSSEAAGRTFLRDFPTSPEFPLVPPFRQLFVNANPTRVMPSLPINFEAEEPRQSARHLFPSSAIVFLAIDRLLRCRLYVENRLSKDEGG
jgi:hypothetical protein